MQGDAVGHAVMRSYNNRDDVDVGCAADSHLRDPFDDVDVHKG
jgi:hypothetical protein